MPTKKKTPKAKSAPRYKIPLAVVLKPKGVFTTKDNYELSLGDFYQYYRHIDNSRTPLNCVTECYKGPLYSSEPVIVYERQIIWPEEE